MLWHKGCNLFNGWKTARTFWGKREEKEKSENDQHVTLKPDKTDKNLSSGSSALAGIDRLPADKSRSSSRQTFFFNPGNTLITIQCSSWLFFVAKTTYCFFTSFLFLEHFWFLNELLSLSSLFGDKMPHFQHPDSSSTATPPSLNGAEVVKHGGRRRRPQGTLGCITVWRKRQFIRRYCLCARPESPRYPRTPPTA